MSMANKAFGRNAGEELPRLAGKPVEKLSKGEASALIDRLKALLPDGGNRDGGNRDGGNRDGGNRDGGNRDGGERPMRPEFVPARNGNDAR